MTKASAGDRSYARHGGYASPDAPVLRMPKVPTGPAPGVVPPSHSNVNLVVIGSPFSRRRLVDEPARLAALTRWQRFRSRLADWLDYGDAYPERGLYSFPSPPPQGTNNPWPPADFDG